MVQRSGHKRREFIKLAGLGLGATALHGIMGCSGLTGRRTRRPRYLPANEKMNIAVVGCAGQGGFLLHQVATENIVALCDVDWRRTKDAFKDFPKAKKYKDYRKMLNEMDRQIDAVVIATPDHSHFPIAMMAMQMGKHVYVEKPMAHTIWETRQMVDAARYHGVVTQMGNHGHSNEGTRLLYEWINSDVIGPVHEVHLWTNRPLKEGRWKWEQGIERPKETHPVPQDLDWNLWLNTAPYRPYNEAYMPFRWRAWVDFGCGALGDMGCHVMDAAFWALDLGAPEWVEAQTSPMSADRETYPEWSIITYQFPARGSRPAVKLIWHDGDKLPPRPKDLEEDRRMSRGGMLFYGDKGTIMDTSDYCVSPRLIPEEKMSQLKGKNKPRKFLPRVPDSNHRQNWIQACKGGMAAVSNFDYAGPLTETVLLGNLAILVGERIYWDPKRARISNPKSANRYLRNKFRKF